MNVFVKLISDACDLIKHMLSDVPGHSDYRYAHGKDGFSMRPVFETQERRTRIVPMPISSTRAIGGKGKDSENEIASVATRPQAEAFIIEKILLDNCSGSPSDWIIHDVKVGNCSQLTNYGTIPGDKFFYQDMRLDTILTAMDFTLLVEYRGDDPEGRPFKATAWGRSV